MRCSIVCNVIIPTSSEGFHTLYCMVCARVAQPSTWQVMLGLLNKFFIKNPVCKNL